jgi:hypothetical protein
MHQYIKIWLCDTVIKILKILKISPAAIVPKGKQGLHSASRSLFLLNRLLRSFA